MANEYCPSSSTVARHYWLSDPKTWVAHFRAGTRPIFLDKKTLAFGPRLRQEIPSSWVFGGHRDWTIQALG